MKENYISVGCTEGVEFLSQCYTGTHRTRLQLQEFALSIHTINKGKIYRQVLDENYI